MKRNFEEMTNVELRAYAIEHRSDEDIEALQLLFKRKHNPQPIVFHAPKSKEEEKEQFELFKQIIKEKESKSHS
ncbi:hypothetical protein NIES2101_11135 [Calothrix sp. HK-06]|nr:hypothetical protein NIES2101_11135 [Calothrix sp. HK-06]